MKFVEYNSIENIGRLRTINDITEYGLAYGDWCVTEKVHGSNFSFWVTQDSIKCAKRSGFIDEFGKFYNYQHVLEDYNKNLCILFHLVSEFYGIKSEQLEIALFGEIFGGTYPHKDVAKNPLASKVQKGVYYSPDNDFYAFDLKVNGTYINYKLFEELMDASDMFWAKSLFISDFKTCLAYPNSFQTKIPTWLELPDIENNICEGVVIKPLDPRFFPTHSRVILKNKNEKFSEIANGKVKEERDLSSINIITLSESEKEYCYNIFAFVTENRLRNVISKMEEITDKDFGKVAGLFTKDVLDEFKKDHMAELDAFDKDHLRLIWGEVKTKCIEMVRTNFVNIMDKNF